MQNTPEKDNMSFDPFGGELFSGFNNVESVGRAAMQAIFDDREIYTAVETTAKIEYNEVVQALNELDLDNYSLSIVEPNS